MFWLVSCICSSRFNRIKTYLLFLLLFPLFSAQLKKKSTYALGFLQMLCAMIYTLISDFIIAFYFQHYCNSLLNFGLERFCCGIINHYSINHTTQLIIQSLQPYMLILDIYSYSFCYVFVYFHTSSLSCFISFILSGYFIPMIYNNSLINYIILYTCNSVCY